MRQNALQMIEARAYSLANSATSATPGERLNALAEIEQTRTDYNRRRRDYAAMGLSRDYDDAMRALDYAAVQLRGAGSQPGWNQ